jgi:hypothetical protein
MLHVRRENVIATVPVTRENRSVILPHSSEAMLEYSNIYNISLLEGVRT